MQAGEEAVRVTDAVSEPYDALIIGAGILGTATAMNLTNAGYRTIVLKLTDKTCPRADTLRNQGWLQSGILYPRKDFHGDDKAYSETVRRTFAAGHTMLSQLGLSPSTEQGIVRVGKDGTLQKKLEERRKLFRYKDFRELPSAEVEKRLGGLPYEDNSVYYNLPDAPFDEAGLIEIMRRKAAPAARFVELANPVSFSRGLGRIRVHIESTTIDPPVMLVAAGAGIAKFYLDLDERPPIELRQTPLLVYAGNRAGDVPPIYVDYERGFSSVRHHTQHVSSGAALVIGTKARQENVPYVLPDLRRIPNPGLAEFIGHLSDPFKALVPDGRFTAGVEVIPQGSSFLDAWIEDRGDVVLASPGRATLGWDTSLRVAGMLMNRIDDQHHRQSVNVSGFPSWGEQVHMHFSDYYASLNDLEEDNHGKTKKE